MGPQELQEQNQTFGSGERISDIEGLGVMNWALDQIYDDMRSPSGA